tara:strand:- start:54 stop:554 length:501 start_codon:yes stop_codon:yes gene_type:complete
MIPVRQFRDQIIRPVLHHLARTDRDLGSRAIENLLLGTAVIESRLEALEQRRGPALSMFQIEPSTYDDIVNRYLWHQRPDLWAGVDAFRFGARSGPDQLAGNQHYACAVARIKYWMSPEPLPDHDDVAGLGKYWADIYNAGGRGTGPQFALAYQRYVVPTLTSRTS